jgi:SAM-dependent methyltransferase
MSISASDPTDRQKSEWHQQWSMFRDDERFLFEDWIAPVKIEEFRDKDVLECGCGGGQHTAFVAPIARTITAVDLNTVDIARQRNAAYANVHFVEADLGTMNLGRQFDIVFSIGVIHHTDDPDRSFDRMFAHCKPGGRVIIWTYSAEGNALVRFLVEPARKLVLQHLPRSWLVWLARALTALMYPIVYTVYRLKALRFLPYYEYFVNFRRLSYERNVLNVFDKLNAPQTKFTTLAKCHEWFSEKSFEKDTIRVSRYAGVSYTLTGVTRQE